MIVRDGPGIAHRVGTGSTVHSPLDDEYPNAVIMTVACGDRPRHGRQDCDDDEFCHEANRIIDTPLSSGRDDTRQEGCRQGDKKTRPRRPGPPQGSDPWGVDDSPGQPNPAEAPKRDRSGSHFCGRPDHSLEQRCAGQDADAADGPPGQETPQRHDGNEKHRHRRTHDADPGDGGGEQAETEEVSQIGRGTACRGTDEQDECGESWNDEDPPIQRLESSTCGGAGGKCSQAAQPRRARKVGEVRHRVPSMPRSSNMVSRTTTVSVPQ